MNDESINPLVRMVNRIHVVEEARHVRFAREEIARIRPGLGRVATLVSNTVSALVAAFVVHTLINPAVYDAVGLDRKAAVKAARHPHNLTGTLVRRPDMGRPPSLVRRSGSAGRADNSGAG